MSLTALNWPLIVSLITISALFLFQPRSRVARRDQPNLARLEDIEAGPKTGKVSDADSNSARRALPSRRRSSNGAFGQDLRGPVRTLIVPAVVFLLVAGIGAATSYFWAIPAASDLEDTTSLLPSGSDPDSEMLSHLADYTRSIGTEAPPAAADKLLPDVSTMIERLAARLETTPDDLQGWQMLGWSYFHTGHFEHAAAAYAKALELDPSSAELKLAFEEAKAKASENDNLETASSLQTGGAGKGSDGTSVAKITKSEAMAASERNAAIRSMVDRLADRLASSPRDVEGWTRLMRSRVVLGERDVAASALRKALEVFKDDGAASSEIIAAATELGLKAE